MDRTSVEWRGYWPAAPTPFASDGSLDESSLAQLVDFYVDAGVHGILVNGSSGEWWAQTDGERRIVAEVAARSVDRRVPLIVGCSAFTAKTVCDLASHAASVGADGILVTPPPYAHPTQAEIHAFYADINDSITMPLMVYNWPRGTAVDIELSTVRRLVELECVVALKNSTGDWKAAVDSIEAVGDQVRVFASLISPAGLGVLRELGGDGYIDGGGLGLSFAVPFFECLWTQDLSGARAFAQRYAKLTQALVGPDFAGRFGSASSQLKAAMALLGQPGGHVRPPLLPTTDPRKLETIRSVLDTAGLLSSHSPARAGRMSPRCGDDG